MTVSNLRCDLCDVLLSGLKVQTFDEPLGRVGVRFGYHPGDPGMRDDSGLACAGCWQDWVTPLGEPRPGRCARCDVAVGRRNSLHIRPLDRPGASWQLCTPHAANWLNALRTVDPKLDPATFRLPLDRALEGP